jgi:hypothetical protein
MDKKARQVARVECSQVKSRIAGIFSDRLNKSFLKNSRISTIISISIQSQQ